MSAGEYSPVPSAYLGRTTHLQTETGKSVARPTVLANPSAVTIAFRELQERARVLEKERDDARKETKQLEDDIKDVTEGREDRAASRNAARLRATEQLCHIREEGNKLRRETGEMDTQLVYLDNDFRSIQMNLTSDRGALSVVEDDCIELREKLRDVSRREELLSAEVHRLVQICEERQNKLGKVPARNQNQVNKLKGSIRLTEEQIQVLRFQMEQQTVQMENVRRYLDMLLNVNDEICDTVLAREEARARVLRLSGRVSLPHGSPDRCDAPITPGKSAFSSVGDASSTKAKSKLAESMTASLKAGPSGGPAEGGLSATAAIAELVAKAKNITSSKHEYVRSDLAGAGVSPTGSAKLKTNSQGYVPPDGAIPLNDVMKVVQSNAARHALKLQKERANDEARLLLELSTGSAQLELDDSSVEEKRVRRSKCGKKGYVTVKGGSKANKSKKVKKKEASTLGVRHSGSASMTRAESIRRANQFYEDSVQAFQYGYDTVIKSADTFHSEAVSRASEKSLAAPVLDWKKHDIASPANKSIIKKKLRARHPAGWNAGVKRHHTAGPAAWNSGAGGGGMKDISTRDTNLPQQKHHEAWLPAGVTEMVVSQNRFINQNKVESVARRHWMQAPYNHYNKLHSPERDVSRSRSPTRSPSPGRRVNMDVLYPNEPQGHFQGGQYPKNKTMAGITPSERSV